MQRRCQLIYYVSGPAATTKRYVLCVIMHAVELRQILPLSLALSPSDYVDRL